MSTRPNILFLLSDQHNPRYTGYAGHPIVATPNLDRLAGEGVSFTNAYCQSPLCAPSRAAMLTGQYCRDLGIYDNQDILESNTQTLPRVLSAGGYRTAVIGKTHFNGEQFQGYEERPYGDLFGQAHQPDPKRLPERGDAGLGDVIQTAGPSGIPLPLTQTEICVAEASKWLQTHVAQRNGQPFFLSVHFDKPHFPICPPLEYFQRYEGRLRLPAIPEGLLEKNVSFVRAVMKLYQFCDPDKRDVLAEQRALDAYCGCIEWVDHAVGRLVETLDYLGFGDNTLVIYASDHGEMATERGLWQKSVFFDSSARVPFLVRHLGKIEKPGRSIPEPIGLIDLFPTFCELANVSAPSAIRGKSWLPLLQGENRSLGRNEIFSESVIIHAPEHAGCMIRSGPWKYNYYLDGSEELYNMEADPDEFENLAQRVDLAQIRDRLRRRVIEFWEPENQLTRYNSHPRMARQKHYYEFSNQFVLGNGSIIDARP